MMRQICEQIVTAQSFQDLIQKGVCESNMGFGDGEGCSEAGSSAYVCVCCVYKIYVGEYV